jgi:hypothetical protein
MVFRHDQPTRGRRLLARTHQPQGNIPSQRERAEPWRLRSQHQRLGSGTIMIFQTLPSDNTKKDKLKNFKIYHSYAISKQIYESLLINFNIRLSP